MFHDFEIEMWRWPFFFFFLAKKMFFNRYVVFSSIQPCRMVKNKI